MNKHPPPVPTPNSLRAVDKRLTKRRRAIDHALQAMRAGDGLCRSFENGRCVWHLTSGAFVSASAAEFLISMVNVVGADDCLLPGHHQTWRYHND
jgi:hypothetical protein